MPPISIPPTRVALAALGAASAFAALAPAQAQSAYTLTVLSAPSDAAEFTPTALDNQGTVWGGMHYRAGITSGKGHNCMWFCTGYLHREVSWAGTGASAAAVQGNKYLFPMWVNDQGARVGAWSTTMERLPGLAPRLFPTTNDTLSPGPDLVRILSLSTSIKLRQGSTETDVSAIAIRNLGNANVGSFSASFTPYGLNNAGAVTGHFSKPRRLDDGAIGFDSMPVVVQATGTQGVTVLDTGSYGRGMTHALNDAGAVAGEVTGPDHEGRTRSWPALWMQGQLAAVGDASLAGMEPVHINQAGQVLIKGYAPPPPQGVVNRTLLMRSMLWFNGVAMPISAGPDKGVLATAMNDHGVVTGCVLRMIDGTQADGRPFLWKNGVMLDLQQELAAKGVNIPAGTRLGCPLAINNSGSVLTYTYKSPLDRQVTWVRLNARP